MKSEVIELQDSGVTCKSWPNHPVGTFGAVGGLFNKQLIICGGFAQHNTITRLCHSITPSSTDNPFNVTVASTFSAGVVLNQDTLLVSGGLGNSK